MKFIKCVLVSSLLMSCWIYTHIAPADNFIRPSLNFVVSLNTPASYINKNWNSFIQYLNSTTHYQFNLIIPRDITSLNQMINNNEIDLIYIDSYTYFLMKQNKKLDAIAQMRNKDASITSRSRIFVRLDSGIKTIEDLRGSSISLISPNGAGSYLAPRAFFSDHNLILEEDIQVSYSGDLKKAVYDVLLNETDAAVMCGVNYDLIIQQINMNDIFILQLTDEFPEAVIAVRENMNAELKENLKQAIVNMTSSYGGREALIKLRNTKIHDFVEYDENIQNQTQKLIYKARL